MKNARIFFVQTFFFSVSVGRISRPYPRAIHEGTPDEVRVRKYRATRDLGAAAHLKLEDDDDEDLNDSVFSGSTNLSNNSEDISEVKTFSRQSSRGEVASVQADSVITEGGESDRVRGNDREICSNEE